MATDSLVQTVKQIVAHAKAGNVAQAYAGYEALFASDDFKANRPEDQRQALRLMVMAKGAREPTLAVLQAHRAAIPALTELVSKYGEPADHELLGICHLVVGNEESASSIFKAGLAIERERNPSSDLCGALMKRISLI